MTNAKASAGNPHISVIILNWNGCQDTLECLASLRRVDYPNFTTVVVDNGSTDGSLDSITREFPDVVLLPTGTNLGYAGGNNAGIRWALDQGTDYILLLNNDTVVAADLLWTFRLAVAQVPPGSVLGAKIYFYDQPDTLWFAGGRWDPNYSQFEHIGYGLKDSCPSTAFVEVDYITGCALFTAATTFRTVGLLDERFFLTYEETDWCYRARSHGYKCILVPGAKVWHKVSSSFGGKDSPLVVYFQTRNKLLWARKHASIPLQWKIHRQALTDLAEILFPPLSWSLDPVPLAKKLTWSLATWVKTVARRKADPVNRAILFALRDYYLGRLGNCSDEVRALLNPGT